MAYGHSSGLPPWEVSRTKQQRINHGWPMLVRKTSRRCPAVHNAADAVNTPPIPETGYADTHCPACTQRTQDQRAHLSLCGNSRVLYSAPSSTPIIYRAKSYDAESVWTDTYLPHSGCSPGARHEFDIRVRHAVCAHEHGMVVNGAPVVRTHATMNRSQHQNI